MTERYVLSFLFCMALAPAYPARAVPPLTLVRTIPMPQVKCRQPNLSQKQLARAVATERIPSIACHFDRFGLDSVGHRLFVVPENNGTVEVYNLPSLKLLHSIGGIGMPHGVLYRPDIDRIFVSDGADGLLRIYDGTSYRLLKTVKLLTDADALGYDPATRNLYIANGGKDAKLNYTLLSIVNTDNGKQTGDIRINGNRLEQMALDPDGGRLFINVTDRRAVGVIDLKEQKVIAMWPIARGDINAAMALDEKDHRLFVACRSGEMDVFDTENGKVVAVLPISKGADDMTYDGARKRIYVPCAEGVVDVFQERDPDHYARIGKIPSGPMGKTGILVSRLNRYYVAVPPHGSTKAEILVYRVR
ncbi:MAG TPA: YncE family protein [Candidatus Dormibacteraeota bacterium]|nr:YncE family protein [Candidatus Dormibacteraeota bacterium]